MDEDIDVAKGDDDRKDRRAPARPPISARDLYDPFGNPFLESRPATADLF